MNRQQRRQDQRRTYTTEECKIMVMNAILETERKYDIRYSLCLATSLSAPPLNFGPKRVCDVVKLFFDQIEALKIGTVSEDQIREEAERLGVIVRTENDKLEIYVDPKIKRKENKNVKG